MLMVHGSRHSSFRSGCPRRSAAAACSVSCAALRLLAQDLRGKAVDAGQTVVCVFGDGGAEAERFMCLKAEILPLKLFVHAHTRFLWTSRS